MNIQDEYYESTYLYSKYMYSIWYWKIWEHMIGNMMPIDWHQNQPTNQPKLGIHWETKINMIWICQGTRISIPNIFIVMG